MFVNLTPHSIHLYEADAPDVIEPDTDEAQRWLRLTIEPSGRVPARITERPQRPRHRYGAEALRRNNLPGIIDVEFGHIAGLPAGRPQTWFVVSLACALAVPGRSDLVVPFWQVRNGAGTVVGCRALARPVAPLAADGDVF